MESDANNNSFDLPLKWHPYFSRNDVNLESYQLLWTDIKLSELEDEEEIFSTLTEFRRLVNYTKAFDSWRLCLKYIEEHQSTFTFLVCSASYARELIPKLRLLSKTNVWKVYIYYKDEKFDIKKLDFIDNDKVSS